MDTQVSDIVCVESWSLRLSVSRENGRYVILHKPTNRVWSGPPSRFCSLTLVPNDGSAKTGYFSEYAELPVRSFEAVEAGPAAIRLVHVASGGNTGRTALKIAFSLSLEPDRNAVTFSYRVLEEDPDWSIHSVRILDEALPIQGQDDYAVLPLRQGWVVPVGNRFSLPDERVNESAVRTSAVWGTYRGAGQDWNMAMFALVQANSTALVTWDDPNVEPNVRGRFRPAPGSAAPWEEASTEADGARREEPTGRKEIVASASLTRGARSVRIHFLEGGDYVQVAKYYRTVARERGLLDPFADKIKRSPSAARNVGAIRFTCPLKWGRARGSGWAWWVKEGESRVDCTFDEAAEVAEHLKNDLGIERALVLLNGWHHGGYDMDYPDVLPAAEECGGNEGLARASQRVRGLGWLIGIHDNPLILFHSSPSTDRADALVRDDGSLVEGGIGIPRWRMYSCCPARMLKYVRAKFPQMGELFGLNYIYLDQLAALPLYECFSSDHPVTRQQTVECYRQLVEYIKAQTGGAVVGSEIIYEWAVPIFDALGASVGHSAAEYAYDIPLFELVYRECVGLEPWAWGSLDTALIVDAISVGRMPYFPYPQPGYLQSGLDPQPRHTGWENCWLDGYTEDHPFIRGDGGWGVDLNWYDRIVKNVYEVTNPLNELTALVEMVGHEYVTPNRKVERVTFANGVRTVINRGDSDYDHEGTLLPKLGFLVQCDSFAAFYARRHAGVDYPEGALFTIRSMDGKPIRESRRLRIYHGFGRPTVRIGDRLLEVSRELVCRE